MTAKPAPRVVIDTNLVLAALLFSHGQLASLRSAWQQGQIQPLASSATTAELIRVLTYPKFKLGPCEQEELLADYLPHCISVVIPVPPPRTPVCRDPFDVPFMELAVVGKAEALLTGDRDLLSLAGEFECPILAAAEFMRARNL